MSFLNQPQLAIISFINELPLSSIQPQKTIKKITQLIFLSWDQIPLFFPKWWNVVDGQSYYLGKILVVEVHIMKATLSFHKIDK